MNSPIRNKPGALLFTLPLMIFGSLTTPAAKAETAWTSVADHPTQAQAPIHFHMEAPTPDPGFAPEEDTFYASFRNHSWNIPDEVIRTNDFWIEVDLTQQMLYAYRGNQLIAGFVVSTGVRQFRTVTGIYKIYAKYPAIDMRGPGYDLADVPYSIFFHKGYAIHGTYWHNNFGQPMSRGCVNMVTEEAAWIYEYAPVGSYVIVHY